MNKQSDRGEPILCNGLVQVSNYLELLLLCDQIKMKYHLIVSFVEDLRAQRKNLGISRAAND